MLIILDMSDNDDFVSELSGEPEGVSNVERLIRTTSHKSIDWVVLTGEVPVRHFNINITDSNIIHYQ